MCRYGEKVRSMQAGSSDTFEELFTYACPKFVSPAGPDFANPAANSNMEAFRTQLRWACLARLLVPCRGRAGRAGPAWRSVCCVLSLTTLGLQVIHDGGRGTQALACPEAVPEAVQRELPGLMQVPASGRHVMAEQEILLECRASPSPSLLAWQSWTLIR